MYDGPVTALDNLFVAAVTHQSALDFVDVDHVKLPQLSSSATSKLPRSVFVVTESGSLRLDHYEDLKLLSLLASVLPSIMINNKIITA